MYSDDFTRQVRDVHDDEMERLQRQWDRQEDRLIKEIGDLKQDLEEANLEILRLKAVILTGQA